MTALRTRSDRRKAVAKLRRKWPLDESAQRSMNGLALLRAIAALHGGRMLEKAYLGTRQSHEVVCRAGHRFAMRAQFLLDGSWCPRCDVEGKRLGLDEAQAFAASRHGACLSKTYRTAREPLRWRCREGHRWTASYRDSADNNEWCPTCRTDQLAAEHASTLDELNTIAAAHGGIVLSATYADTRTKLRFRCAAGHTWEALPDNILKKGAWCRACSSNWLSPTEQYARLREVVARQGGTLLSTTYVNRSTKVEVLCAKGHAFLAQPAKLHLGRWCRTCHYDRMRTYMTQKRRDSAAGRSKGPGPLIV